jgi:ActD protein
VEDAAVKALYALFPNAESAQTAFDALLAAGIRSQEIVVISSEPFEHHGFSHRDKATWIYWIAGAGGAGGAAFAYWLTSMTARDWPIPTGGMPIVAPWPNLIIIFELTMLFAVVATVATLLVTTKLPRRQPTLYDAAVSEGRVLVGFENSGAIDLDRARQVLSARGGEIKAVP